MPKLFDVEAAQHKYPVMYMESMNTVLCQELVRYNRLLAVIRSTLAELDKAIQVKLRVVFRHHRKVAMSIPTPKTCFELAGTGSNVWRARGSLQLCI